MRAVFHVVVWAAFTGLAVIVGLVFIGVGVYRAIRHETGGDTWSYRRGAKKGHKFSVAGNVAWAAAGVACFVAALLLAENGLVPAMDQVLPSQPSPTDFPSTPEPTDVPTTTPTPTPASPRTRVVFETPHRPHGVVCATYRNPDNPGMGCVVTDHSNKGGYGNPKCKILFYVDADGTVGYVECPRENALHDLLYGYPFTGKATPYGKTFDMGVAVCHLDEDGTTCTDPDDAGNVLLFVNDARSTPKVS